MVLVAEEEGSVLGCVLVTNSILEHFFVVPRKWGSGIADALHDAALALVPGVCGLEVLELNHRARRFYERRGWQFDGRIGTGKYPPHPVVLGYSHAHQDDGV